MEDREFYTSYNGYLRRRYGRPVFRVGVDAGFSCPNREAGGCTYCESQGARAAWLRNDSHRDLKDLPLEERFLSIRTQVESGIRFLRRRYGAEGFILYFQANTNTYGSPEELRSLYEYALSLEDFCGFVVSTRSDCLDGETADLLASFRTDRRDVWVELGLQTSSDRLLDSIGRGHDRRSFLESWRLLEEREIPGVIHLILGLPGETREEREDTLELMNLLNPRGIKLHNLHIPRGTGMYREFLRGEITAPSGPRHLDSLVYFLERLPEEMVILRITCDTPGGPGAPRYFWNKSRLYQALAREFLRRDSRQGALREEFLARRREERGNRPLFFPEAL